MTNDEEAFDPASPLTGPEIVMLVEALDALLPSQEGRGAWSEHMNGSELAHWAPYRQLRSRLKRVVHLSFYDGAAHWLESELREERFAITDKLFSRVCELLGDTKTNRRTVREAYSATSRELREARQSKPRPLS